MANKLGFIFRRIRGRIIPIKPLHIEVKPFGQMPQKVQKALTIENRLKVLMPFKASDTLTAGEKLWRKKK